MQDAPNGASTIITTVAPLPALLVGAGQRGYHVYGRWALEHPALLRFVAVVEPDQAARSRFAAAHDVDDSLAVPTLDALPGGVAEACFVAAPDRAHHEAAVWALDAGYHLYLEKPIAATPADCVDLAERSRRTDVVTAVGHVLRSTPFFRAVRDIVQSGRLGDVVTVEHRENVAAWHMAHSFVRGNWAVAAEATPMIVQKCCHDFDVLGWILGDQAVRLASFGSLFHFHPDRAPEGAATRCVDCPVADCPFDARLVYLNMGNTGWPVHVLTDDLSRGGRLAALADGPYGRCVYTAGSDVVDHQVVAMEMASGTSVVLAMHGHSPREERTMRYDGTAATLRGRFGSTQVIEIQDHAGGEIEEVSITSSGGHGGGDDGAIRRFIAEVRGGGEPTNPIWGSLPAHLQAFAAEDARLSGAVIELDAYRSSLLK
jgi:predicted dehydrogenase